MDDSWDVLEKVLADPEAFIQQSNFHSESQTSISIDLDKLSVDPVKISVDPERVILAGSSAGAGTAAYLSQTCATKT
jgi:hypothetical protein